MDHTKIPIIGGIFGWLDGQDVNYGFPILIVGALIVLVIIEVVNVQLGKVGTFIFFTAPLWLPYVTFKLFFNLYTYMIGVKFAYKNGRTVLEIVLPPEVFKSPEAMEIVFTQIWNKATPDNLMETYLDGKRPPNYTLELVSKGGDVRLYATVPNKNVQQFKDAMYSQYPGVEIREQEIDYTAEVPADLDGWACMSFHMGKKKDSEIPIKTYIDFSLDKMPKEEEKVDPMTPMLEMLSAVPPQQQLWIQFIFSAHREDSFLHGQLKAGPGWDKAVTDKIDKLMKRDSQSLAKKADAETDFDGMPRLTPGERSLIEAMERNVGKAPFNFNCRVMYFSKDPTEYNGSLFSNFLRSFAHTEVVGRNGISARWRTDFNYKFLSDPFGTIRASLKKQELREYKLRFLYPKSSLAYPKIMTAEELATIFHLPGKVAVSPTLNRVQSTRAEAPTNLPTG